MSYNKTRSKAIFELKIRNSMQQITKDDMLKMRKKLKKYENIPLSDTDIRKIVDGKCNVVLYPDMHKFKNIDEVLQPYGAAAILYQSRDNYGHWVCITLRDPSEGLSRKGKQILEFFNSYGNLDGGGMPDQELKNIPPEYAAKSSQNYPYLADLLLDKSCQYKLSYNEYQFQKLDKDMATCGRWTAMRILLKHIPLREFYDIFHGIFSDQLVTALTMDESQVRT